MSQRASRGRFQGGEGRSEVVGGGFVGVPHARQVSAVPARASQTSRRTTRPDRSRVVRRAVATLLLDVYQTELVHCWAAQAFCKRTTPPYCRADKRRAARPNRCHTRAASASETSKPRSPSVGRESSSGV